MVVESLLSLVVISSLSVLLGLSYRGGRGSGDGGGGDGGGAAAADELGCSSMLYAGMHCLLLLLHIHASFSAVTHFPHIQTHIHTHTPTHIFQRITLPSHPKRSFPSLLIRLCFMTRIFTVGLISRAQSRQGPCERALLLHQGLFLLPRPVLALETEHVPTLGCPETRNNQRHLRASRTMCTSSSPFRFGLRVPISG